ncbi:hypothetical protein PN36_28525 [Candidatus Thiomargarita nelsonii]|uniref:Uncharacterized protein n=1 Tax=Candidatus Thiomargarita nelsonii TaxID=1003181 RepID=A0A4E0QSG0_9GAMM|nr:hypothetical protein PN36_28525 [Candidatus Thiomargarita nelsonii]
MYREIIKAKTEEYFIKIPKEYLDKEIEILILPFFTNREPQNNYLSQLLSGPTLSNDEIVSWQNQITKGYKNWTIEEF